MPKAPEEKYNPYTDPQNTELRNMKPPTSPSVPADTTQSKKPFIAVGTVETDYGPVDVDSTGHDEWGGLPSSRSGTPGTPNMPQIETPTGDTTTSYQASDGRSFNDPNAFAAWQAHLDSMETNRSNTAINASSAASAKALYDEQVTRSRKAARDQVTSWMKTLFDESDPTDKMFIDSANAFIQSQIDEDVPSDAVMLNMRSQKFYQQRFAANETLRKKGLAEMDPGEYLAAERAYSQTLKSAGLSGISTRSNFAKLIGGEVSNLELADRITNVYDRINNADTELSKQLGGLFNLGLSKSDLAEALLTGDEGAASLKRKVSLAEIRSEFAPRGIQSALGEQELLNLGVTREQARTGAEYAKQGTQQLGRLSEIYKMDSTDLQKELEMEAFKGTESQRRKQLLAREKAAFSGSSGVGQPSLGRSSSGRL